MLQLIFIIFTPPLFLGRSTHAWNFSRLTKIAAHAPLAQQRVVVYMSALPTQVTGTMEEIEKKYTNML
jgi:hypothetical protein